MVGGKNDESFFHQNEGTAPNQCECSEDEPTLDVLLWHVATILAAKVSFSNVNILRKTKRFIAFYRSFRTESQTMKNISLLSLLIAFCSLQSCLQPPDYPNEPEIEYVGMNKMFVRQGSVGAEPDTLRITISYTDGDGDIGAPEDGDFTNNVIYIDSRNDLDSRVSVPFIPSLGLGNGISGQISFDILSTNFGMCCIYDDKSGEDPCTRSTRFPTDTLQYTVYIIDQAGNESNRIETEPIVLLCD